MKEMQKLQPEIERLRAAYKDQPQKMNQEILQLYREHKVNPFGGCLPLFLQFPIFISLYQALMRSIELRGAGFLWIKDLSQPDRLYVFADKAFPVIGNEINILPLLMAAAMFVQQKFTSKTSPSASPEQQKMMMIIFPAMFGFIFYHFPSGLTLYWTCYTIISSVAQWKLFHSKKG
jgi:YidC/Oxa1 family membrane protein insertase